MYIHIGHAKTGTSSIQKFLLEQSKKKECHFLYPETTRIADGHHLLFKSDEKTLDKLLEEITSTTKKNIIISSESGLPNMRHFVAEANYKINFFKEISNQFDTKIIYYVRNHFDVLESSFLQHTKTNNPELYLKLLKNDSNHSLLLKEHFFPSNIPDQQAWIDVVPTRQFNYYANVEEFWGAIFAKKNILTKVFQKNNLVNNDIVQDFISLVDPANNFLSNAKQMKYSENVTNIYNNKQSGYLIDEDTKRIIKDVFLNSNLSYAKKYLNKSDANLLLEGFI